MCLNGRVQFLPGQYNLLSWMRECQAQGRWTTLLLIRWLVLADVRERMAIVHFSAGALPPQVEPSRHEWVDRYRLYLEEALQQKSSE